MLRRSETKFIETRKGKNEAMTAVEKQKLYRIRKKTLKTIEDLTYLAENLPEKQINQIFNDNTLIPFFKAIFHRREADKKRIRKIILRLISEVLGNEEFALRLIPKEARGLISDTSNTINLVESLFFTAMYSE
jgi:hypothetical protein